MTPGQGATEEVMLDALTPAATSDGRTILFVSSSNDNVLELWKADASGRRTARLAPAVTAEKMVVTPDDGSDNVYLAGGRDGFDLDGVHRWRTANEARGRSQPVGLSGWRLAGVHRQPGGARRLR